MTWKSRFSETGIVVAPGIYDALGAVLVEQAGFEAAYLSGASVAYTRHGRPDLGLVTLTEVADTVGLIRERTSLPLVVDADTGFGNALNTKRTVRLLERSGASAIQLEDQTFPKRCGHLKDKTLIPTNEMVGKLRAALDARQSDQTLIIARTDAVAVEGLEAALDRAEAYVATGVDLLFVEALNTTGQMRLVNERFGPRLPTMANMVEGGKTPLLPASELEQIGYSLVIFPGGFVRALTHMAQRYFSSLKTFGTTEPFQEEMLNFTQLNELLGTQLLLEEGKTYE